MNDQLNLSDAQAVVLRRAIRAGGAGVHPDEISLTAFYDVVDLQRRGLVRFDAEARRIRATTAGVEALLEQERLA